MANTGRLRYIAGVVVLCWVAIEALIGIFLGLAHVLNNTTATIIVFQLIIYSALFGFLGAQLYKAQLYKWKDERDGWRRANTKGRDEDEAEDASFAWKRDRKRKIAPL